MENIIDKKYYDWHLTFSKDCHINFILGARGVGKTFGIRCQTINDYISKGRYCMELVRYKTDIDIISDGYHERIADKFPNYVFKSDKKGLYIAKRPYDDDAKIEWEQYGFFGALSEGYQLKRKTFSNKIYRIIFDEFIMDTNDKYHYYLRNERDTIATIISTATRERADDAGGQRPYIYFLANNVDRLCPYFEWYDIDPDRYGYYRTCSRQILVHNLWQKNDIYSGTIAAILQGESDNKNAAAANIAVDSFINEKIAKPPKSKVLMYYLVHNDNIFAFWQSLEYYYVESVTKVHEGYTIFSPKIDDVRVSTVGARDLRRQMRILRNLIFANAVKFDKPSTYGNWLSFMRWLGE